MKVLSNMSVYGIRALLYIAAHKEKGEKVGIRELSEELDISFHFLTKILQSLTQKGLLESHRGPGGGVSLNKKPEDIFLIDVVYILEGKDFFDTCLLGMSGCGKMKPCPVHDIWKVVKSELKEEFETTSLAEMGSKINAQHLRISG